MMSCRKFTKNLMGAIFVLLFLLFTIVQTSTQSDSKVKQAIDALVQQRAVIQTKTDII